MLSRRIDASAKIASPAGGDALANRGPEEEAGFELPVPLATARLSCQPDDLSRVLFGELGFGLTYHQDGEGDGRQHTEAEQHPVEDAGSIS